MTIRLQDFSAADRDTMYPAPRSGDWMLLALLVVVLLGNGLFIWHQRGMDDAIGRAVFFGLALFCVYWSALVYTFKLSVGVWVGPRGICLARGPWRIELAWSEAERLVERTEATNGRRYRWVVVTAYDGRMLQVREDMVANYPEFRVEVYERFHHWQEHGGTWGTNGGGPYTASDRVSGEVSWWLVSAGVFLLPALYFLLLLPEVPFAGLVLLALAALCFAMVGRAALRRQKYTIDPKMIESRRFARRTIRLGWREIARVDRARHAAGFLMELVILLGRLALSLAARSDSRARSFAWSPRVPEYLILRGGGRQIRVRLHRLARPDELLAWVEFYERIGRRGASGGRQPRPSVPITSRSLPELLPADLSGASGPADPWANGRGGTPNISGIQASASTSRPPNASRPLAQRIPGYAPVPPAPPEIGGPPPAAMDGTSDDAWLRETRHQPAPQRSGAYTPPPAPTGGGVPAQRPMAPGTYPGEWDIPDEAPHGAGNMPTDGTDSLADAFAPWRGDYQDERPTLPRFGPPPTEPGTGNSGK